MTGVFSAALNLTKIFCSKKEVLEILTGEVGELELELSCYKYICSQIYLFFHTI